MGATPRSPRNRTLQLNEAESALYRRRLLHLNAPASLDAILDRTICQDTLAAASYLPAECVDLLVLDPPYNLTKDFRGLRFRRRPLDEYAGWLNTCVTALRPCLKPSTTVYVCSEWSSSPAVFAVIQDHFIVRNRITWEREKGRGSLSNWKNCSEDIWYCTLSNDYVFNVDAVKLRRKVLAPYTDADGRPKDWQADAQGNFRSTAPSNLWTDITVPFWSMPENTEHPAQKPEKLLAKLILASSLPGQVVLDPFLGSGTTAVVARKLGRHFVGIEQEARYCCLAEKRLALAAQDASIQGYQDGVFWERNAQAGRRPERANHADRDGEVRSLCFDP